MCGRFTLTSSEEQIAAILPGLLFDEPVEPRYNIAPTQPIAAVLNDDTRRVAWVHWGLIPSWSKDRAIGNRMINARAETVHEKPSFKRPLQQRRCLVLADGFYEWKKVEGQKRKTPIYIRLRGGEPFAFAGLWERWQDPGGGEVLSATIITTEPNALVATIHPRMPVILPRETYEAWLDPAPRPPEEWLDCLVAYPAEAMEAFEVGTQVNRPAFDDPSCIEAVS